MEMTKKTNGQICSRPDLKVKEEKNDDTRDYISNIATDPADVRRIGGPCTSDQQFKGKGQFIF